MPVSEKLTSANRANASDQEGIAPCDVHRPLIVKALYKFISKLVLGFSKQLVFLKERDFTIIKILTRHKLYKMYLLCNIDEINK